MAEAIMFDEDLMNQLENDTTTFSEEEFDVDADYAAPPPPLPDGWYEAELSLLGVKDKSTGKIIPFRKQKWGNIPETYFTQIQAKVIAPGTPQDGKITSRYNVTTSDARQNNASAASLVYRAITGKLLPGLQPGGHMKAVLAEFEGGVTPRVMIRTQLEGQAANASKEYNDRKLAGTLAPGEKAPKTFRGQKTFTDDKGKLTGKVYDPATDETVVAQPAIVDLKPESFTPPQAK